MPEETPFFIMSLLPGVILERSEESRWDSLRKYIGLRCFGRRVHPEPGPSVVLPIREGLHQDDTRENDRKLSG